MAQRNLTVQFKAFRDGFSARRGPRRSRRNNRRLYHDIEFGDIEEQQQSLKSKIGENSTENPIWVEAVDEIKKIVEEIKNHIRILNQQHKNRLLVRFDNSESAKDREIDQLTNEITEKFRQAEKKIKSQLLGPGSKSFVNKSNADYIVRENIKRQLAQDLQQLSAHFRRSQKEYMQRLRSQKGQSSGMDDILGLSASTNDSFRRRGGETEQDTMLLESLETSNVFERDQEIQKIAENINEIATIFQDLATLVIDQGTILDRIDYNLENVQIKTEKGLDELRIADQYSQNSLPFKCIMVLLGIIIMEALVLLLKSK